MRVRLSLVLMLALVLTTGACSKKGKDKGEEAEKPPATTPGATLPASVDLPETVIGYMLIANPQKMMTDAEVLGGKVTPVPLNTLYTLLSGSLIKGGLKDTRVLDLQQPVGFLVLDPKKYESPVVVACQTQGKDKVFAAFTPVWKDKGATGGIHELVREEVDTYGVFRGEAEKRPTVTSSMFVKFENKTLLMSWGRKALEDGAPVLMGRLDAGVPSDGAVASIQVDHLRKIFGMELAGLPAVLKAAMGQEPAVTGMANADQIKWVMGFIADKLVSLVQQTRQIGLSMSFSADAAVIRFGLVPEKDSFLSKLLAAQKKAPLTLVSALPDDHFMAMAFNIQWRPFKEDLMAFSKEVMEQFLGVEASAEFVAALDEMWAAMGDEVAFSQNIGPEGMSITEVFAVQDEKKAMDVFRKVMSLASKLMGDSPGLMGMKVTYDGPKDLGKHDGIALEAFDVTYDLSGMPPEQASAIRQLYGGDKMRMVFAAFDGCLGMTIGKASEVDMKALIDRVRKKGNSLVTSKAYLSAAGGLDRDAGGFMFLSLAGAIRMGLESTYAALGQKAPALKAEPARSGLYFAFSSTPGDWVATLRLPAEHLAEVGEMVKQMMAAQMGQP